METTPADPKKLVYAWCQRADRLRVQGHYDQAEALFKKALALAEQIFAPDALELTALLNNHAVLYKYSGRFDEAEQLYRRALTIVEKQLGPEHPEVATLYHNLGGLDHARGRFAAGEPAARRAVEIRQRAFGTGHPQVTEAHVAADLAALAGLLDGQGKYAESEPIYRHVLAIFEARWQAGDQNTEDAEYEIAINLNNLAALYNRTGRAAEAEPLYRRTLAIKEKLLGAAHPRRRHNAQQPGRALQSERELCGGRSFVSALARHLRAGARLSASQGHHLPEKLRRVVAPDESPR